MITFINESFESEQYNAYCGIFAIPRKHLVGSLVRVNRASQLANESGIGILVDSRRVGGGYIDMEMEYLIVLGDSMVWLYNDEFESFDESR